MSHSKEQDPTEEEEYVAAQIAVLEILKSSDTSEQPKKLFNKEWIKFYRNLN